MRKGYLLAEAMIAILIAGVVATVFTTMSYYTNIQSNTLRQQNTKTILEVVRSRSLVLADDPDNDSFFELWKEDENNTLPAQIGLGVDGWGKRIYYYTIDLGDHNTSNAPYADTNTSISPNPNIVGRLISSGEDMVLNTDLNDSFAQNDDLMLEIGVGELNHFKLYGGSEITAETRAYNSAIISATEPTSPIDGTIWLNTNTSPSTLNIYNDSNSSWIGI